MKLNANIIFGAPATLFSASDEIILKTVLTENITMSTQVTSHALENGAEVTDHVQDQPDKFTVKTVLADDVDLTGEAVKYVFGGDKYKAADKFKILQSWKSNGDLLTYSGPVFSGAGILKTGVDLTRSNLVITGLTFDRDNSTGGGFALQISLQEITIAESRTVQVQLPKVITKTKNKGRAEVANTKNTAAGQKTAVKKKSILKGL